VLCDGSWVVADDMHREMDTTGLLRLIFFQILPVQDHFISRIGRVRRVVTIIKQANLRSHGPPASLLVEEGSGG
jgi:hypothetical protein